VSERVGFIGLGIMGQGMARNLLKAGFGLTVWNRTASRADALVREGATRSSSPAELAAQCDVIVICVSDTPDVGVHMLDAPISGGSEGAALGTLSIMVGGEAEQVERAMPYLEAMGKNITHVGGNGAGQMVKLVNQILVAHSMLALGEAFLFAQAGGLDLEKTLKAVEGGAAGSWTLSNRGPQVIARDWRPGFMIDLQQKDLRLVLEAADSLGVPVLGCSTAFHLYRTLQNRGCGAEGNHALVKALENLADMEVGAPGPE
jgi:3-hydroxyisobutyrate dehydrogenase-like beta-hydroxyacid dehydrogenase